MPNRDSDHVDRSGDEPVAPQEGDQDRHRLGYLDAMRGIACLMVILVHVAYLPDPLPKTPPWARPFLAAGGTGVTLFFLLSAFSLCLTMPRHLGTSSPTLSFLVHRLFRIYPMYLAMLVYFVAFLGLHLHYFNPAPKMVAALLFLYNLKPAWMEGIVPASWTLAVEMMFYLAFPVLYSRLNTLARIWTAVAASLLAWHVYNLAMMQVIVDPESRRHVSDLSVLRFLPIFLFGMALFHLYKHLEQRPAARRWAPLMIVGGIYWWYATAQGWTLSPLNGGSQASAPYSFAVAFGLVLLGCALAPSGLLVNRATRAIGKISYSGYLIHSTVIFHFLGGARFEVLGGTTFQFLQREIPSRSASVLLCFLVTLAVVLPLAFVTYRLIELPGIRAGKIILARLGVKPRRDKDWVEPDDRRGRPDDA